MTQIIDVFECAGGSVIGKNHIRLNCNNQDNYIILEHADHIVATVCDGCGSGLTSEVGATLGSSIVSRELSDSGLHRINGNMDRVTTCLERTKRLIVDRIVAIAFKSGLPFIEAIADSFLFTIVAAVVGENYTYIVSIGDGFYALNEDIREIGPFDGNAPPYIAYNAIRSYINDRNINLNFVVNEVIPTDELQSLLIASDGIADFISAEYSNIPGKSEQVGNVSQFWTDNLFFDNQSAVFRRLNLVNRSITRIDRENVCLVHANGHLRDDTTLVSIRRKP